MSKSYTVETGGNPIYAIVYTDTMPPLAYGKIEDGQVFSTSYKDAEFFDNEAQYKARLQELSDSGIMIEDV